MNFIIISAASKFSHLSTSNRGRRLFPDPLTPTRRGALADCAVRIYSFCGCFAVSYKYLNSITFYWLCSKQISTIPYVYIGRRNFYLGKTLWEIVGNLKNFGVGRILVRSKFERYPEVSFVRILRAEPLMDEVNMIKSLNYLVLK